MLIVPGNEQGAISHLSWLESLKAAGLNHFTNLLCII